MACIRMNKIIITLLILFSATAYGANVDNTLLQKNLDAANTQIEVLKAQVEVMKSYQDNFLTTVYWSLATVLGIVVLLIGYNWFTNFKSQEKELQSLKNHIEQELNVKKSDLDVSVNKKISSTIAQENNKLKRDLLNLKHKILLIEFNNYKNKQIYANCIRVIREIIVINKELSSEYRIREGLDNLVEIMELTFKEGKKYVMSSDTVSILQEILLMVGDQYNPIKNRVNELIGKIQNQV